MNNPYAADEDRKIYFISDAVHLIKTARNSFSSSRCVNGTKLRRLLLRNGKHILWKYVQDIYFWDKKIDIRVLPRLTDCYIFLSAQSQMHVKYAVPVLSN